MLKLCSAEVDAIATCGALACKNMSRNVYAELEGMQMISQVATNHAAKITK